MRMKILITSCALLMAGSTLAGTTYNSDGQNLRRTIAADNHRTCAIRDDHQVVCVASGIPMEIGISDAVQLSTSATRLCAVTQAGKVVCSENGVGPHEVAGFNEAVVAVALASGAASAPSACAVTASGKVLCWGGNEDGQLGDGTTTPRDTPAPVKGVEGVVGLASGMSGTGDMYCAIRYTGGIRCWGDGVTSPIAGTNVDQVRNLVIADGHVCVWRREESASNVHCAPPRQYHNFKNFKKLPLMYPTALAGSLYGGLCVADHAEVSSWKCMDTWYGLSAPPRAAFMTSLSTNLRTLEFGDFDHSCAVNHDGSLRCMLHGALVPPCDIATYGAACHYQPWLYQGAITPARPDLGVWTLIPNLQVLSPTQPRMFSGISNLTNAGTTRNSISVQWTPRAHSTDHRMAICDPYKVCTTLRDPPLQSGGSMIAKFENLRPGTRYAITVQGYNWASEQPPCTVTLKTKD